MQTSWYKWSTRDLKQRSPFIFSSSHINQSSKDFFILFQSTPWHMANKHKQILKTNNVAKNDPLKRYIWVNLKRIVWRNPKICSSVKEEGDYMNGFFQTFRQKQTSLGKLQKKNYFRHYAEFHTTILTYCVIITMRLQPSLRSPRRRLCPEENGLRGSKARIVVYWDKVFT